MSVAILAASSAGRTSQRGSDRCGGSNRKRLGAIATEAQVSGALGTLEAPSPLHIVCSTPIGSIVVPFWDYLIRFYI